jgi:hypothetical protein
MQEEEVARFACCDSEGNIYIVIEMQEFIEARTRSGRGTGEEFPKTSTHRWLFREFCWRYDF